MSKESHALPKHEPKPFKCSAVTGVAHLVTNELIIKLVSAKGKAPSLGRNALREQKPFQRVHSPEASPPVRHFEAAAWLNHFAVGIPHAAAAAAASSSHSRCVAQKGWLPLAARTRGRLPAESRLLHALSVLGLGAWCRLEPFHSALANGPTADRLLDWPGRTVSHSRGSCREQGRPCDGSA